MSEHKETTAGDPRGLIGASRPGAHGHSQPALTRSLSPGTLFLYQRPPVARVPSCHVPQVLEHPAWVRLCRRTRALGRQTRPTCLKLSFGSRSPWSVSHECPGNAPKERMQAFCTVPLSPPGAQSGSLVAIYSPRWMCPCRTPRSCHQATGRAGGLTSPSHPFPPCLARSTIVVLLSPMASRIRNARFLGVTGGCGLPCSAFQTGAMFPGHYQRGTEDHSQKTLF